MNAITQRKINVTIQRYTEQELPQGFEGTTPDAPRLPLLKRGGDGALL
jgi:hypothetical protein